MSEATRIVPAIGHAIEAMDLHAVTALVAMLARVDLNTASRIRDAVIDGMDAA